VWRGVELFNILLVYYMCTICISIDRYIPSNCIHSLPIPVVDGQLCG